MSAQVLIASGTHASAGIGCCILGAFLATAASAQSPPETIRYTYDTLGRLSVVANADNTTVQYLYENTSFKNALTGIIDENGTRYSTWTYDSVGRATNSQEAGGADAVSVVYGGDGSATATDALGAVRTFGFARVGDRGLTTSISGSQCPTCSEGKSTTFNDAGWVISRTDYNDNVTQYTNDDARGLEISRTEAFGTARARTITTTWHASFRLPMLISIYAGGTATGTPLQTTAFTYDSSGNLLTATITDTATSTSRTWTNTYNSFGQVLTANGPRTDINDTTTYTYYTCTTGFQCGRVATVTDALGHVTTVNTYNAVGNPLTMTDANGVGISLAYDARQRVTSRTFGSETTSFLYYP